MTLVLPDGHPFRASLGGVSARSGPRPLRVGIVNIMPKLEAYEPLLLGPLSRVDHAIEPVFLRLETHSYGSSDGAHLEQFYRSFGATTSHLPLDGLIITGAPVEELPFEAVRYWEELSALVEVARRRIRSTLGICWGGLALAGMLGIPKVTFRKKLFGVYESRWRGGPSVLRGSMRETLLCAQSRHSGADDAALERAEASGRVRLLAHAHDTGHTLFETPDHALVMHLGHPEYVADRLVFEWNRDRSLGRADVAAPHDFDPERPSTAWYADREDLFARWTALLGDR